MQELNEESQGRTEEKLKNDQEYEKWKEGKAKKLDKLEDEVKKISAENNKLWDEYNASKDAYWKQKQYIDFIEWQTKVKNHKIY